MGVLVRVDPLILRPTEEELRADAITGLLHRYNHGQPFAAALAREHEGELLLLDGQHRAAVSHFTRGWIDVYVSEHCADFVPRAEHTAIYDLMDENLMNRYASAHGSRAWMRQEGIDTIRDVCRRRGITDYASLARFSGFWTSHPATSPVVTAKTGLALGVAERTRA